MQQEICFAGVNHVTFYVNHVIRKGLQLLTFVLLYKRHSKANTMKRNEKLIKDLNSLLVDKLTAINLLMVHSEMCENLRYIKLHASIQKLATDQMLHAEWIIERISLLDGFTALAKLNSVMIAKTISELLSNRSNPNALRAHKDAILLAMEVGDITTAELLKKILTLEEDPAGWAEIKREQTGNKEREDFLIAEAESQAN